MKMKIRETITQAQVWNHWFKVEHPEQGILAGSALEQSVLSWRSDIKGPLPHDLVWYTADIEEGDIEHLHIISSSDWSDISQQTYLVEKVAGNLKNNFVNKDSLRISKDIQSKLLYLRRGGTFDTRLVLVSDKISGPFTILEGNRRAVALLSLEILVGTKIYLGVSNEIKHYMWSNQTYKNQNYAQS
jgi:hypothetical protein